MIEKCITLMDATPVPNNHWPNIEDTYLSECTTNKNSLYVLNNEVHNMCPMSMLKKM